VFVEEAFIINVLSFLVYTDFLQMGVLLLTITFENCVKEVFSPKRDVRLPRKDPGVFESSLALEE